MIHSSELYRSSHDWLPNYVHSSFRLSGRFPLPGEAEISAHRGLLMCTSLSISNIAVLASYLSPGAEWREPVDVAPITPTVCQAAKTPLRRSVEDLLALANAGTVSPDELLLCFGRLQPFSEGNDLIGRALWMWRMAKGSVEEFEQLRSTSQAPLLPRLH